MKRVVLDASALVALLDDRPSADKVENLLRLALEGKRQLSMSVVNWGEVYYSRWRLKGREAAEKAVTAIEKLPIEIVDATPELTKLAAQFRAQYRVPYVDCFAAALAHHRKASLATADRDFAQVEKAVPILWLADS